MSEQGHPLFSPRTIPDNIPLPEIARYLRMIYQDVGLAFSRQQQDILNDPRFQDDRVAHSLRGMAQAILIIDKAKGSPGDVLTLVDQYNCVFASSVNPGPGGVTPTVTPHNILSATHADTTAASVVRGDLMTGQGASPLWKRLAKGANGEVLLSNGTDLLWGTPLTGGGWTDDGTVVRLTTATDRVGIGTASPTAMLSLAHPTAGTETLLDLTANATGRSRLLFVPVGTRQALIDWSNTADFGPALGVASGVGCPGTRFMLYNGGAENLCDAYGQDSTDDWVLIDPFSTYTLWTGDSTSASRKRAQWQPNGELDNYGPVRSRKFTPGTTGLSSGVPGIELEETGSGTDVIRVRAPSAVAASRVQTLLDLNGTIPVVGDDPPAVASRALGKVDLTAQAAGIASTALTNSAPAGFYLVEYQLLVTTLDATAGSIRFDCINTDDIGAQTQSGAAIAMTAQNRDRGHFTVQLASGSINYAVTVTAGAVNNARYSVYVRVISLG